ncbi:MAG: 3'-5' exonuclease [Pseudomonadota bacterium]
MLGLESRSLRFRVALFFVLLGLVAAIGTIGAIIWLTMRLEQGAVDQLVPILGGFGFALVGLITWIALKFDEHLAKPIMSVAAEMRTIVHADAKEMQLMSDGRYLGMLAPAAAEIADALVEERARTDARIADATADAAQQKEELESLLRDLRQGLVICTLTGRLTLYNRRATEILHVDEFGDPSAPSNDIVIGTLGLGRDFFNIVDPAPFEHAIAAFERTSDPSSPLPLDPLDPMPIIFSTRDGARTMRGQVSPRLNPNGNAAIGFVVTFEDVTAELAEGLARDRMLRDVANDLKAALEIAEKPAMAAAMAAAVQNLETTSKNIIAAAWPMTDLSALRVMNVVKALAQSETLNVTLDDHDEPIHGDSATLITLLLMLVRNMAKAGATSVELSVTAEGRARIIRAIGNADTLDKQWLDNALQDNADESTAFLSGNEILERHRADIDMIDNGLEISFPINTATKAVRTNNRKLDVKDARPEFYDFDLFKRQFKRDVLDIELERVHYVVFDCEMTGLDPAKDTLCSIAGARVVNERVLSGEVFDTLINPGRPIPPASTAVHHITDEMVANAPPVGSAIRKFHNFARGQVLVAHNAAFDMAFLSKAQPQSGVSFDHVVLDTVLLAAHLFGSEESLTLDTLAKRFDVIIPPEARHTAIGDAVATADVLIGLLRMLRAQGVTTLRDVLKISEQQTAIRRRQKEYA